MQCATIWGEQRNTKIQFVEPYLFNLSKINKINVESKIIGLESEENHTIGNPRRVKMVNSFPETQVPKMETIVSNFF